MTCQLRNGLLVHPFMEHGGDEIVAKGVEVEGVREIVFLEDLAQMLCESVRVDGIPFLVDEQVRIQLPAMLLRNLPLAVAESLHQGGDILGQSDRAAAAILGGAFHHTLPGHHSPGTGNGEHGAVLLHQHKVLPPESAQLPAAAAGVHGQHIEELVVVGFVQQGQNQLLGLLVCGDELLPVLRIWQIDHPGGVALDDFISLGIAEHGGHHGQVFLHRGLLDGLALVGAFPQLDQHILQSHGPQLPQLDGPNVGVDPLQHPPVAGQSAGSVLHLTLQPPGGVCFKGGVPVLGVAGLHPALQLFRFVGNVLGDAPGLHRIRHGDGLSLADFLAVRAVAVADGDLEFPVR